MSSGDGASSSGRKSYVNEVVVVGAGFAGMYMLHKLRGLGFDTVVLERADDVGGTWYWNRYPGARCDIESMQYSYSFDPELEQEWEWTERYSSQPEILRYANHVADRYDLRRDIRFETTVERVDWDDKARHWRLRTDRGEYRTRFVVMATGCLSTANTPQFDGIDSFEGDTYHTGRWPHEGVDLAGKSVAVIGTGSSAVQAIPVIAQECEELTVFQRTPNYSIPARNEPLDPHEQGQWKANYSDLRAKALKEMPAFLTRLPRSDDLAKDADPDEFVERLERHWEVGGFTFYWAYGDTALDPESNQRIAGFVRAKIADAVHDPEVAAKLTPHNTIACKRPCLDTSYFETYNLPHVRLVDVSESPIECISPAGVVVDGQEYAVDTIVFATGFDAMTGTLLRMNVTGRGGIRLAEHWDAGPRTYLGLGVTGFPNLFTVSGPGSPSVLTNMIASIEQHVNWIAECLGHLREHGIETIEAQPEAEAKWVDHVNAVADMTLYPTCNSWYLGSNIPGKTRVFMPLVGFPPYVEICDAAAADGYQGFALA
ncbi:flavin-containing monooxygenase [Candidatus Poriferisodalis sp.]|uniref:flavin-containing monooxygenase n=1 Tax=Candidatus Poriferisodalis sp. TaxID=3101277 RepID=UPI003AF6E5BA